MTKRIAEFDLWRPGYGGAVVSILVAGTSTLASVFYDEGLTQAAPNPQTLEAMAQEGGIRYGKFSAPLYIGQSYQLNINGIEDTGIVRPAFSSLDNENASNALVTVEGSAYPVKLSEITGRQVNVSNFGPFVEGSGGVAATNTATMELAIAALADGGYVNIPTGLYKVNDFDIPENVVIRGQGIDATILQSVIGAESFTIVGQNAGFKDITLDGNSLSTDSVGVKSEGHDGVIFENVKITRFETGMYLYGGSGFSWYNLSIINVETAAKLFGEDVVFEDLVWVGGIVSTATTVGVFMSYEDQICQNITFIGVGFEACTEPAVSINGAQNIRFVGCWWYNNTKAVKIMDDTDVLTPATRQQNDTIIVQFEGGRMDGGSFEARDTAQNVVLSNMTLRNLTLIMTTPIENFVVLENCYESGVTISGEAGKLIRSTTSQNGAAFGVTTTNVATKAWAIPLRPGQQVYLEAKVIGKGRNVAQRSIYHMSVGAFRPGSTLNYDTQTANFTTGAILTGQSSGATARIQADSDSGTTGTLTLTDIRGEFLDNEIITDNNGTPGSATANGTLSHQSASLDTVGVVNLRSVYETNANWAATFAANGPDIELRVTGDTSQTVEWTVHVDVVST